ncbi:MAG: hypothetical protein RR557_08430 [Bacilli bacterium]
MTNSEIVLNEEVDKLENLNEQSLRQYFTNFEQLAMQCLWTEEQKVGVLQSLIDQKLKSVIQNQQTYDGIIRSLLKYKYPDEDANKYLFLLQNIKQNKYTFIKEYLQQIEETTRKYANCLNMTEDNINYKIREFFMQNLSNQTRLELSRQGILNADDMVIYITRMEDSILQFGNKKYDE